MASSIQTAMMQNFYRISWTLRSASGMYNLSLHRLVRAAALGAVAVLGAEAEVAPAEVQAVVVAGGGSVPIATVAATAEGGMVGLGAKNVAVRSGDMVTGVGGRSVVVVMDTVTAGEVVEGRRNARRSLSTMLHLRGRLPTVVPGRAALLPPNWSRQRVAAMLTRSPEHSRTLTTERTRKP